MSDELSDFEMMMQKYSAEEDDSVKISEPEVTKEEFDDFMSQIERAKAILKEKGEKVGICYFCFDTGFLRHEDEDGYEGVQYKIDNDLPELQKCMHGVDRYSGLSF